VITDVDGTLVTSQKVLTKRAKQAVNELRHAGIHFSMTSGRPPRGLKPLIDELEMDAPIAAFNGGMFVQPDLGILDEKTLSAEVARSVVAALERDGHDVWIYRGQDWVIRDLRAAHVDRERQTVRFDPKVVRSLDSELEQVVKIVGVSDDFEELARTETRIKQDFNKAVSAARSQPYYLDVTHPDANKGFVIRFLSEWFKVPLEEIATLGDMPNDIMMFEKSGLSIAMGNANEAVKKLAARTTDSHDEEGFAKAVEKLILNAA
jgi:Cof subfamily protein (haloacid dehalogenase superfamily)